MAISEFEEKEYEGPLYNQLETNTNLIWSPGQVFEEHIGIDRAIFIEDPIFWKFVGHRFSPAGSFLHRYNWDYIWQRRKNKRQMPNFALNLFIQAKRPYYHISVPKKMKRHPVSAPLWHFDITPHQQVALEKVAQKLNNRALVCYATPAFHRLSQLYVHTRQNSIIANSSFPNVSILSGHEKWWYNQPGSTGIKNPDYEFVEGISLLSEIEILVSRNKQYSESKPKENIAFLAQNIKEALLSNVQSDKDARLAQFAEELRNIGSETELYEDMEPIRDYLYVKTFCSFFNVEWFVLG